MNTATTETRPPFGKRPLSGFGLTLHEASQAQPRRIRVNAVLPGPIWTPFKRPGQPAELASAHVMLASDESSYTSGAVMVVSGGSPIY